MKEWTGKQIDDFIDRLMKPVTMMMRRRVKQILEAASKFDDPPAAPEGLTEREKGLMEQAFIDGCEGARINIKPEDFEEYLSENMDVFIANAPQ